MPSNFRIDPQLRREQLSLHLRQSASFGEEYATRHLLEEGADTSIPDKNGRVALMLSALYGKERCFALLLPVSDARALDSGGMTALMHACAQGHAGIAHALIPCSDASHANSDGMTALMFAACKGLEPVVASLLGVVDPLAVDALGQNALMHACLSRASECVELLIPVSDLAHRDRSGALASEKTGMQELPELRQRLRALEEREQLARSAAAPSAKDQSLPRRAGL